MAYPDSPRSSSGAEAYRGRDTQRDNRHRPRARRKRRARRIVLVSGLVVLLVVVASGGYAYYLTTKIHRVAVRGLTPGATTGADAGSENILMIGSTSRCALAVQNIAYGLCQGSATTRAVNGVNSDVIMILHLNPAKRSVSILSIPRDLFLPNARSGNNGGYKIDAALYQGQSQLVNVIQKDFGIPIQHSVELNFDTFANVVNAFGGINMYFPMPLFDRYSGLNVPTAGCIHLDGFRALQVVRARHLQYKPPGVTTNVRSAWPQEVNSDLGRINRDHEFLRVLAATVAKRGLGNPVTDLGLVNSVASQLKFDNGFSTSNMVNLLITFHAVNVNSAPQLTLPVSVGPNTSYYYGGFPKGSVEFPAQAPDQKAIDTFLQIGSNTNTMTGAPLPSPSSVTVSVLNGSGTANQAATTQASLDALGFKGVGVGNTPVLANQLETLVEYSSSANLGAAETVAHSMTGAVTMIKAPTTDGAQVTVVTGTQFAVNAPAAATSTTATTGQSSSTSASAASASARTSAGFQPPSPSTSKLQPWDPRACSPSGGPAG